MPRKKFFVIFEAIMLLVAGCGDSVSKAPTAAGTEMAIEVPPHVADTVAQYAMLIGGRPMQVQNYGVVVGLGENGSSEAPPAIREDLIQYILKQRVFSQSDGTSPVSASMMLADKDTALVRVWGVIPPGAPLGTRFDVFVSAMPQTQTRSLDGGFLMPRELQMVLPRMAKRSRSWARAGGAVFVNPFVDPSNPDELPILRRGRVIGGGEVIKSRELMLQLIQPDYARCVRIRDAINSRFQMSEPVTVAKNPSTIQLKIPFQYRREYERFLRLIMHLPIGIAPARWEAKAREIAEAMALPSAEHEELALIWEAMGRQVLPAIKEVYASKSQAAAFYAAVTGMRLGDTEGADIVAENALNPKSAFRLTAVRELGRHRRYARVLPSLHRLIDDENQLVRIAAYEALVDAGDRGLLQRIDMGGQFKLDLVKASRGYVIYAWQSREPRLVLFGKDMTVRRPLFFSAPDDFVIINGPDKTGPLSLLRKIPRTGRLSGMLQAEPQVSALIKKLTAPAELDLNGEVKGLGLTYSQIVGVLQRMCEAGHIPAEFRLQSLPEAERIYKRAETIGRPDT